MPTVTQGNSQSIDLAANESIKVTTSAGGEAYVDFVAGAPGAPYLSPRLQGADPKSQVFGPYGLPAKLRIRSVYGTTTYEQVGQLLTLRQDASTKKIVNSLGEEVSVGAAAAVATVAPNLVAAPAWDAGYRAALAKAKAGTGLCRISALTDSVGYGYYASNLDTLSWLGIVKTALQGQYGDGGSGIVSVSRTKVVLTADSRAAAIQNAWEAAGNLVATTGTWVEVTNGTDGPGGAVLQASTAGATATFVVRGSTVEIFYQSTPSTTAAGSFTYQIDGGPVSSAIQAYRASQGAVEKVTITGLTAGVHTVVITATDANGTLQFSLCGVSGRNASGVVVDQCSRGGQTSDVLNTGNSASWTAAGAKAWGGSAQNLRGSTVSWNGGTNRPCDLALLCYTLNDATTDKSPSTVLNNHRMALENLRSANPDVSILFVRNHRGNIAIDGTQFYYSQYGRDLLALAKEWNCGFLNLWAAGKNSLAFMNANNYMSANNTQVGISGNDGVHLSDAGHAWQGGIVLGVIG